MGFNTSARSPEVSARNVTEGAVERVELCSAYSRMPFDFKVAVQIQAIFKLQSRSLHS
jgi:hypothetical protein